MPCQQYIEIINFFSCPSYVVNSILLAPANWILAFFGGPATVPPTGIWRLWSGIIRAVDFNSLPSELIKVFSEKFDIGMDAATDIGFSEAFLALPGS